MNDRYLFRAKHIHKLPQNKHLDGIWVVGYISDENYIYSPSLGGEFLIDPTTVCQCTGVNSIFEKDIVRKTDVHKCENSSIGVIEYDFENAIFLIHWIDTDKYSLILRWKDKIEVIGNIFDDPELLGNGSEKE